LSPDDPFSGATNAEVVAEIARDPEGVLAWQLPRLGDIANFVGRHFRLERGQVEDLRSQIQLKLVENDYAALRAYKGEARIGTYLVVFAQRVAQDFRDRIGGKWRPSAEARRMGPPAIEWDAARTRDGLSFDQSLARLQARFPEIPRESFEEIDLRIPERTRRRFEGEETVGSLPARDPLPDERLEKRQDQAAKRRLIAMMREMLAEIPAQDRLLTRLKGESGLKVSEIARGHGFDQKQLYRRWNGLCGELRRRLEARGISAEEVAAALRAVGCDEEDEP